MRSRRRNSSNSRCQFIGGPLRPRVDYSYRLTVFELHPHGEAAMDRIARAIETIVRLSR
jgi:hypothetical protein